MMTYIPGSDSAIPAWLTAVLRDADLLRTGSVTKVTQTTSGDVFNSHALHLAVEYSHDANPGAPARMVLKRNIASPWGVEAGLVELAFYRHVTELPGHPPITVPCYAAEADPDTGDSYLLLQDLSSTHTAPVTRDQVVGILESVPPAWAIEAVAGTLASLHAYWWDHPSIAAGEWETGYWARNADRYAAYLARRTASWEALRAAEGDRVPTELLALYDSLLARLPRYWERQLGPRFSTLTNLTLVHGDAYFSNFLCPHSPEGGATYLLDWQSYSFDIGAMDLANLCATFWTADQRHKGDRELQTLRRYYKGLQARGVTGYTWDELVTDYRHALIFWVLMPVQDRAGGSSRDYWWPKMQCLVSAYHDWDCDSLLEH